MRPQTKKKVIYFILVILFIYYLIPNKEDHFTIGLASGKSGNGTNFSSDEILESAGCVTGPECEQKRTLLKETIDSDHKSTGLAAKEAAEEEAGGIPETGADPGSSLWYFSNYRPLAECETCTGLGGLAINQDYTDEEIVNKLPHNLKTRVAFQVEGIIDTVHLTDKEGRTDDYKPSREWVAATCLEDPDCVGFQLDRSEGTAKLISKGAELKQQEGDEGDGEDSDVQATDIYFLHPYRALKWQLEGKNAPGLDEYQGAKKEEYQWKSRIRKLYTMTPKYNDNERHDKEGVLATIPWDNTEWTDQLVGSYGSAHDMNKADKSLMQRRSEGNPKVASQAAATAKPQASGAKKPGKKVAKKAKKQEKKAKKQDKKVAKKAKKQDKKVAKKAKKQDKKAKKKKKKKDRYVEYLESQAFLENTDPNKAKAAIEAIKKDVAKIDLNPIVLTITKTQDELEQAVRSVKANTDNHKLWVNEVGKRFDIKNKAQASLNSANDSAVRANANYTEAVNKESLHRKDKEKYSRARNANIKEQQYWLKSWDHHSLEYCNHYIKHWNKHKEQIQSVRDSNALSYDQKKKKYSEEGGWTLTRHSGKSSVVPVLEACKIKIDTVWSDLSEEQRNAAFRCVARKPDVYDIERDENKLLEFETEIERARLKKYGQRSNQLGDCNWGNKKNLDCGDCKDKSDCQPGVYGKDHGILSYTQEKVDYWKEQGALAQTKIDQNLEQYQHNNSEMEFHENERIYWNKQKSSRLHVKNAAEHNQRKLQNEYNSALNNYNQSVTTRNNMLTIKVNSETYHSTKVSESDVAQKTYDDGLEQIMRLKKLKQQQMELLGDIDPESAIDLSRPDDE